MIPEIETAPPADGTGEPTWEVAYLFPEQGTWSEQEYLDLTGNRLLEFSQGQLEVLVMPTQSHQLIVAFLYQVLVLYVRARDAGSVLFAPLRVRLWPGKYREPDIVFMLAENAARRGEEFWEGADLVVEVVSDDDRRRDLQTKRFEYARAGIKEYWIVDPAKEQIVVLTLEGDRYQVHGEFGRGSRADSLLLDGLTIDVAEALDSAK